MTKQISLTRGQVALVDDEDFDYLNQWKWCVDSYGYAVRTHGKRPNRFTMWMHRLIMNTPKGMDTDHINGNRLDNRKSNLRVCNRSQNKCNVTKHKDNKSGYKGVSWFTRNKKWQAQIMIEGKTLFLGYYDTPEDAAVAYNKAAVEQHQEYAKLNDLGA